MSSAGEEETRSVKSEEALQQFRLDARHRSWGSFPRDERTPLEQAIFKAAMNRHPRADGEPDEQRFILAAGFPPARQRLKIITQDVCRIFSCIDIQTKVINLNIQDIRLAHSCAAEARQAVAEFHRAVTQPDMELVIFFCSSEYDLDVLAAEMNRLFAGTQVLGCTTAGEIGPAGYRTHSLSGVSFPAGSCVAVSGLLDRLSQFDITRGRDFAQTLLQRLEKRAAGASPETSFAFMFIDGLSIREEPVTHALQYGLGKVPLFGGSAGDDLRFAKTGIYCDGRFHSDCATLILINTTLPFRIFKTQHFVSTHERLVVTEADTARRIVKEINGLPATEEYARLVGVTVQELDPLRFAASPVVVMIDGTEYVRSIQKANADGSLTFFCAIEEGLVFRVAQGVDLVNNLEQTFAKIRAEIGRPQLVFGCDCILRNLEISQNGLKDRVEEIFRRNNTIGFSSYGEQFQGVHVNQTLTGIAIGAAPETIETVRDA